MMALSQNPNPTNGIPYVTATRRKARLSGRSIWASEAGAVSLVNEKRFWDKGEISVSVGGPCGCVRVGGAGARGSKVNESGIHKRHNSGDAYLNVLDGTGVKHGRQLL